MHYSLVTDRRAEETNVKAVARGLRPHLGAPSPNGRYAAWLKYSSMDGERCLQIPILVHRVHQ